MFGHNPFRPTYFPNYYISKKKEKRHTIDGHKR